MGFFAQQQPSAAGQAPPTDPLPAPGEVSGVLRDILADPDFATFEPSLRQRALEWIFGMLSDAWNWLQRLLGEDGTGIAQIVVVVVALVALLIMVRVAARHAPRWLGREQDDGPDDATEVPETAGDWLRTANRRAGRGEYRPAASALYHGFLLTLEQRGALSFHSSKTPGDYALEMVRSGAGSSAGTAARAGPHTTPGTRFLDSFQDYSFGQEEATPAGYADLARIAQDAGCPADLPEAEAEGT